MIAFSIIVVTSGRPTLTRTLQSIAAQPLQPQDEVLVVGNWPFVKAEAERFGYRFIEDGPFGCWGQRERQAAMAHARGTHLLFMDDDDYYTAGAFDAIREAVAAEPHRPIMFRMLAPNGQRLWIDPVVACGNISGTQFVTPNVPAQLGVWGLRREGDFDFIQGTLATYPPNALTWNPTVIAGCRDQGVAAGLPVPPKPLKVLLVHPGASWSTADVEAGLRYGLEKAGVEIIRYRLDTRIERAKSWLYASWRRARKDNPEIVKPTSADVVYQAGIGALEMALRHQVDVVVIVSGMFLHPDVVVMMKRAGLLVTVLFTETPYDIAQEMKIAAMVDGCWTNERAAVPTFCTVNHCSGYLPHAWHPERHYLAGRALSELPSHDVVFVGSGFPERITWFNSIDWTGIDLGLYGTWGKELGLKPEVQACVRESQIDNVKAAALYRRAKIGLNLYRTSAGPGKRVAHPAESLSPRAYELAACGAFHLSEYREEVAEIFGDLVPTFNTPAEAEALIRHWLRDPEGRARVAAALPACVAESSWAVRAACVVRDLEALLQAKAA